MYSIDDYADETKSAIDFSYKEASIAYELHRLTNLLATMSGFETKSGKQNDCEWQKKKDWIILDASLYNICKQLNSFLYRIKIDRD